MGKVLKVREVGDPILYKKCSEIDIKNINHEILEIIDDMKETLKYYGGFGISAPQVGVDKRICIIKVEKEKCKYLDAEEVEETVIINPVWENTTEKTYIEYEGCLSVPNISGKVQRFYDIKVNYYNKKGELITKEVSGFTARDIQHECDHLEGIVFLDKVENNGFATKTMVNKYNLTDN